MSITEQILGRLGSEGTYSFVTASALIAAMLILPSDTDRSSFLVPPQRPYYKVIKASDSSTPECQIAAWGDAEKPRYHPKTTLGKRLMALRTQAITKGLSLLNADEIVEEIRRRRGERV